MRRYLTERRLEKLAYYIKSRANVTDTIPTNLTENLSILYTGNETTVDTFTFKPGFIYQYKNSEWHEVPVIADDEVAREAAQEALSRTASDIEYSGDVSGATNIAEALNILAQGSTDLGAAVQVVDAVPQNPDDDVAILYNGETGQGFTKGHIYQYSSNAWTEIEIVDGVAREAAGTASSQAQEALSGLSGKADKVNNATSGNFAGLDGNGNITDSGKSASDFLSADTPLPEQVQSDWDETDDTKLDYIKNKPNLASVATSGDYNDLNNKPGIPAAQVNSDWNSSSGVSEILNKPTLGTAAAKNSTNTVSENNTNLVESGAVKEAIDAAIASVYKPAGNKTVAELTSALLIIGNLGNVYNMTTSGVTTSDFVEGQGKDIEIGDNVAIVDIGTQGSPVYKFDLLSGMVDLTNYVQKSNTAGLLKNDGSVDTTAYAKQSEMSVTPGTGTDNDKTTIQLKSGTSATVLTQHIPAGSSTPQMDGTGSAGSSTNYARADHVHPSDTSKQDVLTFDSVPTENSTNPVESGGIYTELQGKADTEDLTIPTDAVLHYSFDEIPDYPDGTALYFRNQDFSLSDGWSGGSNVFTVPNGILTVANVATAYIYKAVSITNPIVKCKIRTSVDDTVGLYCNETGGVQHTIATVNAKANEAIEIVGNINTTLTTIGFTGFDVGTKFEVLLFYIGDGSYATPIIDNANGQLNSMSQSGFVTSQGISGKCVYKLPVTRTYINAGKINLNENFTISFWLQPKQSDSSALGVLFYKIGQILLRNGMSTSQRLSLYLYGTSGTLLSDYKLDNILPNDVWVHIAITRNGTSIKYYKNGILTTQKNDLSDSTIATNDNDLTLLGYNSSLLIKSNLMDDFQIFDRALSEQEVLALYYNHGNTPKYYTYADYKKADKVSNATAGHLASLDSNGNLTDSGKGSTSSVTSGSTDLVESGAVADAIENVTDIASSLPTDAVLHYSFDEVPDYPDGTAIEKHIKDFTSVPSGWDTNSRGSLSVSNGELVNTVTNNTSAWIRRYRSTAYTNIIVKVKVRFNVPCTVMLTYYDGSAYKTLQQIPYTQTEANRDYILIGFVNSTNYLNIQFYTPSTTDFQCFVSEIYIGDGSYSTPIIDNANGQYNAVNNGGIATKGVSGKGVRFLGNGYITGAFPWKPHDKKVFTVSCWVKNWDKVNSTYLDIINDWETTGISNVLLEFASVSSGKTIFFDVPSANGCYRFGANVAVINWNNVDTTMLHVVGIFNGQNSALYVNGEKITITSGSEQTLSDTIRARQVFQFGRIYGDSNAVYDKADFDDFQIFNRALSETEVQALYYNHGNTPKYVTASPIVLDNNSSVSGKAVIDYVNAAITQVINTAY